ncbi:TMV resistance protein N-like [Neltuma alba]|uniref:TMV resistance protein N-like n=1 Tax=Neltuma alba TaxID=207710 RepID=UPI0010A4A2A7|nr:TMV resistance protein N-like [Prosopis alba]
MAQPVVSSCIDYKWGYDVFLSFHGEDTRLGFVAFLRESLRQRGIHVFIDDEFIRSGEEITPALLKAIQESRIAIIVFSENYANSTFCLQELAEILECFKEEGRLIYPVFYYVDPSELRRPRGSYAKALAALEERFNDDKEKVQSWRLALSQAANLKGCHLKPKIANEQEHITKITDEVSARINRIHNHLHVTQYPIGLVSRVKEVVSHLDLWSTKKNKMVGIVGPGGIGKSTIARALYNSIADHFEGLCFLSNVREKSKMPNGLAHLQQTLLCKLVKEKDPKIGDLHEGIPIIKQRLSQKKILLVIDDIDELKELEALAGSCDWFGPGSRIVITTRNKQLLASSQVKSIYNVRELNDKESLQLLCWRAFKKENVECDFMEVSKRAIRYCCGFPLVLEVIGSHLCGRGVNEWHSAFDQFKRIPEGKVLEVLRLSYDALGEFEKEIFLHLACFSKGEELGEVKAMLLCLYGIPLANVINVLVNKCLIKIEGDQVLMHDVIEDMGKEIVRQESPNKPGERRNQ